MHIHILGICGTFMGGVAQLAAHAGHRVTGCDAHVYPPMSDQLRQAGIDLIEGYDAAQMAVKPDLWVIGNAIRRGNPLMEAILNSGEPYVSGPQWIAEHILRGRHVFAVAGTHGKTTTTSMLAWILQQAELEPGFLVGGVPLDFGVSARLGEGVPFVIEADEYDTAFFDKRSKFVHYRPRTAILNNLEYDHADIFENVEAIEKTFHHLVRTMPSKGLIVANAGSPHLEKALAKGYWSRLERFNTPMGWNVDEAGVISYSGMQLGVLHSHLLGHFNQLNALAAIAAARDAGVSVAQSLKALETFEGVKRRLEVKGSVAGIPVIDDFAHHPTAIRETIAGLRGKVGRSARILAVFEPRSNTMKLGAMRSLLPGALADADLVFCFAGPKVEWDAAATLAPLGAKAHCYHEDMDGLVRDVVAAARPGDHILCMSNGSFGGIHARLLAGLAQKFAESVKAA